MARKVHVNVGFDLPLYELHEFLDLILQAAVRVENLQVEVIDSQAVELQALEGRLVAALAVPAWLVVAP